MKKDKNATQTERMYCVKCRTQVIVLDPSPVVLKNGKHALKGNCPHCDTKTFKIVSSKGK